MAKEPDHQFREDLRNRFPHIIARTESELGDHKCDIPDWDCEMKSVDCWNCGKSYPLTEWADKVTDRLCTPECREDWNKFSEKIVPNEIDHPYRGPNWGICRGTRLRIDSHRCTGPCGISNEDHKIVARNRGLHAHHLISPERFGLYEMANHFKNLRMVCYLSHNMIHQPLRY